MKEPVIHISVKTILMILGVGVSVYVLFLLRDLLLIVFVSLIFAALIDPFANWLQSYKLPRSVAVLCIYIVLFSIITATISILTPIIVRDVPQVASSITQAVGELGAYTEGVELLFGELEQVIANLTSQNTFQLDDVFSQVGEIVAGVFALILTLVITFYFVVQDRPLESIAKSVLPPSHVPKVIETIQKIQEQLGQWMRAQLMLSLIMGGATFIGLTLIGVRYAALSGVLAALFEFVPYIGPVIAALPALFFGFSSGGVIKLVVVLIFYVVLQQIENHILVPKVMQSRVGLNPIVSILAVLIGARLGGIAGALVAIPLTIATQVVLQSYVFSDK